MVSLVVFLTLLPFYSLTGFSLDIQTHGILRKSQTGNDLCALEPGSSGAGGNSHVGAAVTEPGQLAPRTGTGKGHLWAAASCIKTKDTRPLWLRVLKEQVKECLSLSHPPTPARTGHIQATRSPAQATRSPVVAQKRPHVMVLND